MSDRKIRWRAENESWTGYRLRPDSRQRLPRVRGQRVVVVGGYLLVELGRPLRLADPLVRLAELKERVGPALGAGPEVGVRGDRQVGPVQLPQVQVAEQPAGEVPPLLVVVGVELFGLRGMHRLENRDRLL